MTMDRNLIRGFVLMALAVGFGLPSVSYSLGSLGRAGPGMFPFIVSCMLFVIGVITVVRARLVKPVPLNFQVRNISIILGSLCGFALLSHYLNHDRWHRVHGVLLRVCQHHLFGRAQPEDRRRAGAHCALTSRNFLA